MVYRTLTHMIGVMALLATNTVQAKSTCNALAMSGGGAKGAYEAGVLHGLYFTDDQAPKDKYAYDVVTGVSAGAINTACAAVFDPTDVENWITFLGNKWEQLQEHDVWISWKPAGIISGITSHSGVLDDSALSGFIESVLIELGGEIKRKIVVSCVDVNTGVYHTFNETVKDPVKAVVSSASIPFVFPHQTWPNGTDDNPGEDPLVCMDGGTVYNTNLVSAIERCRETVDDDKDITLDIIICDSPTLGEWSDQNNALSNYLRFNAIKSYYDSIADIYRFKQAFPDVNYRYYSQPSTPLAGGLGILNFNNETSTFPMQMVGRLDGENAVKSGEGFFFDVMD